MSYYKLNVNGGKVKYMLKQKRGSQALITKVDSAKWMLNYCKPYKSADFPGYPIAVTAPDGTQYYFEGEWN